jgi:glycosyltransferase involved in cell wall biosynthesis
MSSRPKTDTAAETMTGRVLHLTLTYGRGGRSQAIRTLLQGLRHLGVECDLCCLEELTCAPQDVGGLVGAVDALERRNLVDWKALCRLHAFCRERRIRVIHAHDAASQFAAALVRLRHPGIRLLMTFHRTLGFESARFRDRARNAFAGLLSSAIITGSRERQQHFLRENLVHPRKVLRIPFGVDTRRFRPDPATRAATRQELGLGPDDLALGAVGHFGEEKGLHVVLKAFAALARGRASPPPTLVVVGDGNDARRELLRSLAGESSPGRVVFTGQRGDVERLLPAFDLLVHAPRQEAFGLVLIEAMAVGLPVVATAVGGVRDIIRHGDNGLLVAPDCPQDLAAAAAQVLASEELRRRMGRRSREIVEREFRLELYAQRHLRLYRGLLAGRRPASADEPPREATPQPLPDGPALGAVGCFPSCPE